MVNKQLDFLRKIYIQKENWNVYIEEIEKDFDLRLKSIQDRTFESLKYSCENYDTIKDILIDIDKVALNSAAIETATKSNIVYLLTILETNLHIIKRDMIELNPCLVFKEKKRRSPLGDYNSFILEHNNISLSQIEIDLWSRIYSVYRPIRNAIVHNFSRIDNLKEENQSAIEFIKKNDHLIHVQNYEVWFETQFIKDIANDIYNYMDYLLDEIIRYHK